MSNTSKPPVFPVTSTTVATIPALCDQLIALLRRSPAEAIIVCDLSDLSTCDLTTIHALARLQLTARRRGHVIHLRNTPPRLAAVIRVFGLEQTLPTTSE